MMKVALALAVLAAGSVLTQAQDCDTFKGCYVRNLRTGREIELVNGTVTPYRVEEADEFSIRCATNGVGPAVVYTDFFWDRNRTTEWGEPVFLDGDSNMGAYVVPVPYLKPCGLKTVKVQGHVWTEMCYERFYTVEACGVEPTKSPTKAPTKAPTKEPTKAPTVAPTKEPTKAPTKPPTKAPTKPPTKPPTMPPTNAPTKTPTNAPTMAPTNPPVKSDPALPVASPVDQTTPVSTSAAPIPVTAAPVKATSAPVTIIRPTLAPKRKRTGAPKAAPKALPAVTTPVIAPKAQPVAVSVPVLVPVPLPVPVSMPVPVPVRVPVPVSTPRATAVPAAQPQSRTVPTNPEPTFILCKPGYKMVSGYCVAQWCTKDFECPVGSNRRPDRECYTNRDDCTCSSGYVQRLGRCALRTSCKVGLNWLRRCPSNKLK